MREWRSVDFWWGTLQWRRGKGLTEIVYAIDTSGVPVVATGPRDTWQLSLVEPFSLLDWMRDSLNICPVARRPNIWVDTLDNSGQDTMVWPCGLTEPIRYIRIGCHQCYAHADVRVVGPDTTADEIMTSIGHLVHTPPREQRRVRQVLQSVDR